MGEKEDEVCNSKKEKQPFDNKIMHYIDRAYFFVQVLAGIMGKVFGGELPRKIFLLLQAIGILGSLALLVLVIYDTVRCFAKYRRKKDKIDVSADNNKKKREEYGYKLEELRRKTREKLQRRYEKWIVTSVMVVGGIAILCLLNPTNTQAVRVALEAMYNGEQATDIVGDNKEEEMESDEKGNNESDTEHTNKYNHQDDTSISAPKPKEYRFVLEDETHVLEMLGKVENKVYFYKDGKEIDLAEQFSWQLNALLAQKKEGINITTTEDQYGKTYSDYNIVELQFKDTVKATQDIVYWSDWIQKAPRSSELDEYIAGRMNLNSVVSDGKCGNYQIWWKLANDYQYYAQEYEAQTENSYAIWYYYTMSIYCCMEALQYDMPTEEYKKIFNYMEMRYQDICREESLISMTYKLRAKEILDEVRKYDMPEELN